MIRVRWKATSFVMRQYVLRIYVFNWLVPLGAFQSQLEFGNVGF